MRRLLRTFAPFIGVLLLVGGAWVMLRSNSWAGLMVVLLILMAIGVRVGDAIFYESSPSVKGGLPKEKTEGEDAQSP